MTLIQGFIQEELFYDDAHFPHGFRKSGDFSIAESELLTNVGRRLFSLVQGHRKPENQVEEQFVEMCQSKMPGQTKVEILWLKYKALTKYKPFHPLSGQT